MFKSKYAAVDKNKCFQKLHWCKGEWMGERKVYGSGLMHVSE